MIRKLKIKFAMIIMTLLVFVLVTIFALNYSMQKKLLYDESTAALQYTLQNEAVTASRWPVDSDERDKYSYLNTFVLNINLLNYEVTPRDRKSVV